MNETFSGKIQNVVWPRRVEGLSISLCPLYARDVLASFMCKTTCLTAGGGRLALYYVRGMYTLFQRP